MLAIFLQAGSSGIGSSLFLLLMMFVVMFFFFIRPQVKKQKEQNKFLDSLEKGEEVVTASGLIGRINKIEGGIITLTIAEKTFVRVTKGSVSREMTEAYRKAESASGENTAS
jgi:preprotein translocase subunit YajC